MSDRWQAIEDDLSDSPPRSRVQELMEELYEMGREADAERIGALGTSG
jgi:hypothetical protein